MAVKIATASGHIDLLDQLIRFACGYGEVGAVAYTGVGDGAFTLGGAAYPSAGTSPTTITESWAITCTVAAANGGTFSVVGSVSGAQADASVGVAYDNGLVNFLIADGLTDFQVGDQFTFSTTQNTLKAAGQEWIWLGRSSGQTTGGWIKGRGLAGSDSIYVGLQAVSSPSDDSYNIQLAGSYGFDAAKSFALQTGYSGAHYSAFWNDVIPYWFVANGQRIIFVGKVSTTYHSGHFGKILPYATPAQYGYPVYIGGETQTWNLRWSSTNADFRGFVDPAASSSDNSNGPCRLSFPDGTWYPFGNRYGTTTEYVVTGYRTTWPYMGSSINDSNGAMAGLYVFQKLQRIRDNLDGSYTLLPIVLHSATPAPNALGELDGCFYISGHGNGAENTITIGADTYLVVQDIYRTARYNYWALKLA